ncbi:MAG: hypothetical protein EXQ71_08335 [Acidimicrobiia bacterium]|nr:hypothetical protein [Acidimicrobiia bacterium]
MTDTPVRTRPQPALLAIIRYTLLSAAGTRRWRGMAVAAIGSVLFGMLAAALSGGAGPALANVARQGLFALVLPITCLVIGDAVLGSELRTGAFTFTWLSPVSPWQITMGRWFSGSLITGATLGPAFALVAIVAGVPDQAGAIALAGVTGAAAYIAVFMAIGCFTRRAAAWSLGFVFLTERLVGGALSAVAQWSPSWVADAVFVGLTNDVAGHARSGIPQGWGAVVRLILITVVALVMATRRLRYLRFGGASD